MGTRDVLPGESARWEQLIARFAGVVESAGYALLHTPLFEDLGVFQRIGEDTDVVRKEMYEFDDKGGRRLALRPEGTAPVTRAFAQHRPQASPWKVWYVTPCFRYERPQAGRYRQHHQLGIEAIGSADPDLDVEVIALGHQFLSSIGLRQVTLLYNSLGTAGDRVRYVELLGRWLAKRIDELDPEDREKVATNPMRVLDSKRAATRHATAGAPRITDHLSAPARSHFERVLDGLSALGIGVTIEPRLVRGLDYYNHSLFEFVSTELAAAQATVLGGGRYDGLVEALGGPPAPGVGFGSGIERVLLACDGEGVFDVAPPPLDAFVVDVTGGEQARDLTAELRGAGLRSDRAFDQRSMRAQMKAADRSGAVFAVIVGSDELARGVVTLRQLRSGIGAGEEPQRTVPREDLVGELLASRAAAGRDSRAGAAVREEHGGPVAAGSGEER